MYIPIYRTCSYNKLKISTEINILSVTKLTVSLRKIDGGSQVSLEEDELRLNGAGGECLSPRENVGKKSTTYLTLGQTKLRGCKDAGGTPMPGFSLERIATSALNTPLLQSASMTSVAPPTH